MIFSFSFFILSFQFLILHIFFLSFQVLLDLARMIFEEQSTIEHMVFRILTHTQSLIQCQRVQVIILHDSFVNEINGNKKSFNVSLFYTGSPRA